MLIDWSKIVTNAVSAIVVAVLIGAGTIIWVGVTTIDDKINAATSSLETQATYLNEVVNVIQAEMVKDREQQKELADVQQDIIKLIEKLSENHASDGRPREPIPMEHVKSRKPLMPSKSPPDFIQQQLPMMK